MLRYSTYPRTYQSTVHIDAYDPGTSNIRDYWQSFKVLELVKNSSVEWSTGCWVDSWPRVPGFMRPQSTKTQVKSRLEKEGSKNGSVLGLVFAGPTGITVYDRLLHPHLRHCSSAASAVRWLLPAAHTMTPELDVQSSGLFSCWPGGMEPVHDLWCSFNSFILPGFDNFSVLILLPCTVH